MKNLAKMKKIRKLEEEEDLPDAKNVIKMLVENAQMPPMKKLRKLEEEEDLPDAKKVLMMLMEMNNNLKKHKKEEEEELPRDTDLSLLYPHIFIFDIYPSKIYHLLKY